jgi:hypothetical protein
VAPLPATRPDWLNIIKRQVQRLDPDYVVVALLFLAVTIFHWPGIRPGYTFVPVDLANGHLPWNQPPDRLQNWLISDPLYQFYPFLHESVAQIQSGAWPLWTDKIFMGHPIAADPLFQPFYPVLAFLGVLAGPPRGLALGLYLHALLAALLMYGFLRTIVQARSAAFVGALTWALSGYLITWFATPFWTCTLAWLPGVLWGYELALSRRSLTMIGLAGLSLGLATLAGQFSFVLTFCLFFTLYAGARALYAYYRLDRSGYLWATGAWALSLSIGLLLAAIQVLTFAEFLEITRRRQDYGLSDPLAPQQLISLLIPDYFGNPSRGEPYWGTGNYSEETIYAGLPALILALSAIGARRRWLACTLLIVTMLLLYFVVKGPGVEWMASLPIVRYISLHRSIFLLPLLIGGLAALSLDTERLSLRWMGAAILVVAAIVAAAILVDVGQLQLHWDIVRPRILWAGFLTILLFALWLLRSYQPRLRTLASWGIALLVFADLFSQGRYYNPTGPVTALMAATPGIEFLQEHAAGRRLLALQRNDRLLFGPNVLASFGLGEAGGYSSLVIDHYHRLVTAGDPVIENPYFSRMGNMVLFSFPTLRLIDLLRVSYVVSPTYLESGIRSEVASDECSQPTDPITQEQGVAGLFTVKETAINRLDLLFHVDESLAAPGTLLVRLWRGANREIQIAEFRHPASEVLSEQKQTYYFAPEAQAPGETYAWEVIGEDPEMGGVSLCASASGEPALSVFGADWQGLYEGEFLVYERQSPLPQAYVVYQTEVIAEPDAAVSRLLDEEFDPRRSAIVSMPTGLSTSPALRATPAVVTRSSPTRFSVDVTLSEPGLLLLAEQYHPGWQATVAGHVVEIVPANLIWQGLLLPSGNHTVEFDFAPRTLKIGGWLFIAGLILLLGLIAVDRWRQRNHAATSLSSF